MHEIWVRNVTQKCIHRWRVQPFLPRSRLLHFWLTDKWPQNKHTYFSLYYLGIITHKFKDYNSLCTFSRWIGSVTLSDLYPQSKGSKCIRNASKMYQKCIPNCNLFSLDLSDSNGYKNQNKHTYFSPQYLGIYHQIYPKFNLLSLDLSHSSTVKIPKIPNASEVNQKCIRNVIPNSTFSTLDLSHSNRVNFKTMHTYFLLYYLWLIPNLWPQIGPSLL